MRQPPPRLTILAAAIAACVAVPAAAQAVFTRAQAEIPTPEAACDRVVAQGAVAFADTDDFHARLAGALRARPETLAVDVARPFAPETTPDRLHSWLVETSRQGGAVIRRDIPCGAERGSSRPVTFGMRAFITRPGDGVANAVRGYDAVLWLEQATGAVRQVQFTRRGA